jgi:hypothetical protein
MASRTGLLVWLWSSQWIQEILACLRRVDDISDDLPWRAQQNGAWGNLPIPCLLLGSPCWANRNLKRRGRVNSTAALFAGGVRGDVDVLRRG